MTGATTKWDRSRLDSLRRHGDSELDPLLDELRQRDPAAVRRFYDDFVAVQLELPTDNCPDALAEWMRRSQPLPSWASQEKLTTAVAFADRWLPELLTSYLVASLPTAYAGAKGAMVLNRASLLRTHDPLLRRVLETLLFVLRVNETGGLEVGGTGYELVRRVRVFHGVIRMMVEDFAFDRRVENQKGDAWDDETFGVAVNQVDLLGTLWTFALTPIEVLERAGARLDQADKEAVVHLWCVVGHLLGVGAGLPETVLPMDYAAATACWEQIREHELEGSPEGCELMRVLIEKCRELIPLPPLRGLPAASIRLNLGRDLADDLGVPAAWLSRPPLIAIRCLFFVSTRIPGASFVRAPVSDSLKRFALRWLAEERMAARPRADLSSPQQRRLEPMRVRPALRRTRPGHVRDSRSNSL